MTVATSDTPPPGRWSPLRSYASIAGAGGLALVAVCALAFPPEARALWLGTTVLYAAVSVITAWALRRSFPHGTLGYCNAVTQVRLALLALVATCLMADPTPNWAVFTLATLTFALDGADGWLARREGLVSEFGARFDMEVDSLFALVLALGALASGAAGLLILLLGTARYLFWAAHFAWPWLAGPLPERFSRKAVCVAQIATLVALQAPGLPPLLGQAATVAVALILLWSFERDIRWQWQRHRATQGRPSHAEGTDFTP
ncbi:MAG: CDP-alcohol phosphatidyltransferase family protein [Pseudomonadota bacterium]